MDEDMLREITLLRIQRDLLQAALREEKEKRRELVRALVMLERAK